MSAWHQRGAAIVVVSACHVVVLCALCTAQRGGIARGHRSVGDYGKPLPMTWVAPLAFEAWTAYRPARADASIVPHPVSRASPPRSPRRMASPVALHATSRTESATGTPARLAATPVLEKTVPDDDFDSRSAVTFIAADSLDLRPVAVSEPDIGHLAAASVSGLPVVLRVFVGRSGQVVRVEVIAASEDDTAFVAALEAMIKGTLFLPGKRDGADVAAFFDVKLHASEPAAPPQ